jgi:hypothetical protein
MLVSKTCALFRDEPAIGKPRIIPAAAAADDVTEARTFRYMLDKVLCWARAGEVQAIDAAYYDASSDISDVDSDASMEVQYSDDSSTLLGRVPIVVALTPPSIEVQHNTAKRLTGLRHVHNRAYAHGGCHELLYAADVRLQQYIQRDKRDDDDTT